MPKKACATCRHYQVTGFEIKQGYCHWLDAYPGMQSELPMWASRQPYPVFPQEGSTCPQWQEALP